MKIVIHGRPATKKNHSTISFMHNKPVIIPSKAYRNYEKVALMQLNKLGIATIKGVVDVRCRYFLPNKAHWPDLVGLLQATSDILQAAKVIVDDVYIASYDGSTIAGIDKENPRVEIEISPAEDSHIVNDVYVCRCDTTRRTTTRPRKKAGAKTKVKRPASISYLDFRNGNY